MHAELVGMTAGPDAPPSTALEELRRVCAPYVGMLVANGDAVLANKVQSEFKNISQELRQDETANEALQRQLNSANHQIESLTHLVKDLSMRLMAANGELRREVARADLAEGAVRAQVFASRSGNNG
jgi:septal ring factor EnvC (AmiA/AmiB activator)